MTAAHPRPRVVTAGFWCWVAAAVALVAFGLLIAFSRENVPTLFRGAGALFILSGLALGYLAGRANGGHAALRRAAIGLSFALVVVLAFFSMLTLAVVWLVPMILVMVGAVLMLRPSAQAWFDGGEVP